MNNSISIIWHIDDVRMAFDNPITDDQCREVLRRVDKWHDCNIGVNWEVLSSYAEQIIDEVGK